MGWGARWLRLLPLSIGAMVLLFVVKLAVLIQGGTSASPLAEAGRAMLPAAQAASPAASPAGGANAEGTKAAEDAKASAVKPAEPVAAASSGPAEPPPPSEAERAVLQDLRARRVALDARAQALESREALLAAAERRLSDRVNQMAAMQAKLEALDATRRERDEANWRGLVKTYETMRPRDAAAIFNDLDQGVLIQVLDRMKDAKAGQILAAMQPERARQATVDLAKWRSRTPEGKP